MVSVAGVRKIVEEVDGEGEALDAHVQRLLRDAEVVLVRLGAHGGRHQHELQVLMPLQKLPGEVAEEVVVKGSLVGLIDDEVSVPRKYFGLVGGHLHEPREEERGFQKKGWLGTGRGTYTPPYHFLGQPCIFCQFGLSGEDPIFFF